MACKESRTGKHEIGDLSVVEANEEEVVLDVTCTYCDHTGSLTIKSSKAEWDAQDDDEDTW